MSKENTGRYGVMSVHMDANVFEISYYDRLTKHEHTVKGLIHSIPAEAWLPFVPAWDTLITAICDERQAIHAIGDPFPEKVIEHE